MTDDNMALPTGRTCSDCTAYERCQRFWGCKGDETSCDWAPSRFYQRPEVHRG